MNNEVKINKSFLILYIISCIFLFLDICFMIVSHNHDENLVIVFLPGLLMILYYFIYCLIFIITTISFIINYKNKKSIRQKISIMYVILLVVSIIFTYIMLNPLPPS